MTRLELTVAYFLVHGREKALELAGEWYLKRANEVYDETIRLNELQREARKLNPNDSSADTTNPTRPVTLEAIRLNPLVFDIRDIAEVMNAERRFPNDVFRAIENSNRK
ncbi:MAG: hypothetical protein LBU65_03075 [Planctomycetaceae bacterium]|nr:hypothetical protein [Planctomycetaceae bacterium]